MGHDVFAAALGAVLGAKVLNDDTVSPGWLGLLVVLVLGAATVLLLRSFRRQLKKVPPSFDAPVDQPAADDARPGTS